MQLPIKQEFKLSETFIERYKNTKPKFGYNGLGYFVFLRTYSRVKEDGKNEQWWETCKRVVEGCYAIQKAHIDYYRLGWNQQKAQRSAQEMFDRMFNFKFLPGGRSLWAGGTSIIMEKGLTPALYNCSFVSTDSDFVSPYTFAIDALMLGVGVGFDTKGAGKFIVKQPKWECTFTIPDSREGWVESIELLLKAFQGGPLPKFDYSLIRPEGAPIKTFGGTASGYKVLEELHQTIVKILTARIGNTITQTDIVDIMNNIGKAVVAGNVRRSAELALGENNTEFLNLKNYDLNPERASWGWASNNSIVADIGMDYTDIAKRIYDNGEPGIIWMKNVKKYGRIKESESNSRDFRASGLNPCAEITLESQELCVAGNTRILTKDGYPFIQDVVGKNIEVWNGNEWSTVIPRCTRNNSKLVRVSFSDGSYLDCTDDHKFSIQTSIFKYRDILAKDLKYGDVLESVGNIQNISGISEPNAFEWGFFAGDGYIDGDKINAVVCGDKIKLFDLGLQGVAGKPQIKEGYTHPVNRLYLTKLLKNTELARNLNDKDKGIPEYFFTLDKESTLNFISGWIETDGTIQKNKGSWHYRIYGCHQKMLDIQLLCRRVGIMGTSVSLASPKGFETQYGARNYDLYYVTIPSYSCKDIPTRYKKIPEEMIASGITPNNAHTNSMPISNKRRQKVSNVVELDGLHDTFCFTEEKEHKAVFNNVLTRQCNLIELFPTNAVSKEDFLTTIKYAYLYAKTVTLLDSHWPESNKVMLRNRRIGISLTGIAEFIADFGVDSLIDWCETGYSTIKKYDKVYSEWFAIPESIKLTCVKPSGTVSLLAGTTPGMHYPESQYYIRRVRLAKNSPYVFPLLDAGYKIEPCYGQEDSTVVVEFPVFIGENIRTVKDISIWEQFSLAALLQEHWADNSVSVTITFDKDTEARNIKPALDFYQFKLKAVSLLPRAKQGAYKQMPYEEITKEQYETMVANLKELDFSSLFSTESIGEKYCTNDLCSI